MLSTCNIVLPGYVMQLLVDMLSANMLSIFVMFDRSLSHDILLCIFTIKGLEVVSVMVRRLPDHLPRAKENEKRVPVRAPKGKPNSTLCSNRTCAFTRSSSPKGKNTGKIPLSSSSFPPQPHPRSQTPNHPSFFTSHGMLGFVAPSAQPPYSGRPAVGVGGT